MLYCCRKSLRFQWPRVLRHGCATVCLLGLWIRIRLGAFMFVSGACCVLLGRVLYSGLITRPKQSYRMWCVLRVFSAIHLHPTLTSALCSGELHDTSPVPQEKFLLYLLNRRLCTALSYIEGINSSPLPGIETRLQGCR
jgi:hypothetical protein